VLRSQLPRHAERLGEIGRQAIVQAVRKPAFNRTETAKALAISRRTLISFTPQDQR
jgi:DNA-binding NtrC family response regulator